jgi:hypothetical protein
VKKPCSFSRVRAIWRNTPIGNEEQVSVTPVRTFKDNAAYASSIVVQTRAGNVETCSRSSL